MANLEKKRADFDGVNPYTAKSMYSTGVRALALTTWFSALFSPEPNISLSPGVGGSFRINVYFCRYVALALLALCRPVRSYWYSSSLLQIIRLYSLIPISAVTSYCTCGTMYRCTHT
jgi:hypothetical protein